MRLTEFQKQIIRVLRNCPMGQAGRREVVAIGFPEKWSRKQGRAALVGHVDRACLKMSALVWRLDPKNQWDDATLALRKEGYTVDLDTWSADEDDLVEGRSGRVGRAASVDD